MRAMRGRWTAMLLLALVLAACGGGAASRGGAAPTREVRLVVRNNAFSAVTIYAVGAVGDARRVGTVNPAATETFRLNGAYFPTGTLRLVADPIGGSGRGSSGPLPVMAGQTVTFTVQPSLSTSYATVN